MKLRIKPGEILSSLWQRFAPSAVLCALIACWGIASDALYIFMSYNVPDACEEAMNYTGCGLAMGMLFATAMSCLCGRYRLPRFLPWIAAAAGAVTGLLLYHSADADMVATGIVLCCLALCFHGVSGKDAPALRLCRVCGWFCVVLGVSIVLWGALSLSASAFFALLMQDSAGDARRLVESIIPWLTFLLFAPWMFLGGLPGDETPSDQRTGLRKLIYLVMLPLYLVLLAVLLVYVAKIAVTFTMPVGVMNGYAIAALTLFVYFHLMLTGEENRLSKWFTHWGGLLLVPILAAQSVGVWMRVSAYGLTAPRLMGIVWTAMCLAVVLTALIRKRADWFFAAAAVVAILITCTPLNANRLSILNQEARLHGALTRAGMLSEQGEVIPNPEAADEDREIIYSSIDYLENEESAAGSLMEKIKAQLEAIAAENGISSYSTAAKELLLGFTEPGEIAQWTRHSYAFRGTARHDSLDTRGYAHAEWVSITQYTDSSVDAKSRYFDADVASVADYLEARRTDGEPICFTAPILLVIDDESADLAPLLSGALADGNTQQMPLDELLLPSGRKLHFQELEISNYAADGGLLTDYISFSGWLMTPDAE